METRTLLKLSEAKIEELKCNIVKNATPYGSCMLSGSRKNRNSYVYTCISETCRGITGKLVANHRLIYFCYHKESFTDRKTVISHLCHNKSCININHLSLEPQAINIERKECYKNKSKRERNTCKGHEAPYGSCIFV